MLYCTPLRSIQVAINHDRKQSRQSTGVHRDTEAHTTSGALPVLVSGHMDGQPQEDDSVLRPV